MLRKLVLVLVAAFIVSSIFVGCSQASSPSSTGTTASATSAASTASAATTSTTTSKLAWFAPAPHPYFTDVQKGVDTFEKDTGMKVTRKIGPDWTQNSENQQVEALAAQGITGIALYPSDASGANGLYDELVQKGIHVISFGTSTLQPTKASFAVATDVKQAAIDATNQVIQEMGGKGNIINVLEVLTDPNTALRKQGVEEAVAKHPGVKIIQEVAGINSSDDAVSKISAALSANAGNVDGMVSTGDTATSGMCQVLNDYYKQQPNAKKIAAIGIDTDPVTIKAIQLGVINGTVVQNSAGHAYISLMLLKYLDEGYKVKPGAYFVNTGDLIATKDNLSTYQAQVDKMTQDIVSKLTTDYLTK